MLLRSTQQQCNELQLVDLPNVGGPALGAVDLRMWGLRPPIVGFSTSHLAIDGANL